MPNVDRLKLELRRARVPALQYLFVLACALFALGIFFKNQFFDRPWVHKRTFQAQFADVKGVTPGAQRVRIAGVDVGIITGTRVGPNDKPILTLKIDKKYGELYKNAQLRLRPLTPLQDIYVDVVSRGTPSAGVLKKNDVLPEQQTTSAVDVSRVLNTFDTDDREHLKTLYDELATGLGTNGGEQFQQTFLALVPFLKAAQKTSQDVADRRAYMARLVHNLGALTQALAARDTQLTGLVKNGSATLRQLGDVQGPLDATLRELPATMTVLRSSFASLRSAEDQLDPALVDLKPVTQNLQSGLKSLSRFSTEAKDPLESLREPFKELQPLAHDLAPTTKNLSAAFATLRTQAPQFDRITAEMPQCFDTVGKFFNNTLSVTKFYDEYGPFPRGENETDGDVVPGKTNVTINLKREPRCTDAKP